MAVIMEVRGEDGREAWKGRRREGRAQEGRGEREMERGEGAEPQAVGATQHKTSQRKSRGVFEENHIIKGPTKKAEMDMI